MFIWRAQHFSIVELVLFLKKTSWSENANKLICWNCQNQLVSHMHKQILKTIRNIDRLNLLAFLNDFLIIQTQSYRWTSILNHNIISSTKSSLQKTKQYKIVSLKKWEKMFPLQSVFSLKRQISRGSQKHFLKLVRNKPNKETLFQNYCFQFPWNRQVLALNRNKRA